MDDLSDSLPPELSYRRGAMYHAEAIIETPRERAAVFDRTKALVVEMENRRVREVAKKLELGYIGIRAISDCATDTLNPTVIRLVDDVGRVKLGTLAMELVRRPALALELRKLRKTSTLAVRKLAAAVREVVVKLAQ